MGEGGYEGGEFSAREGVGCVVCAAQACFYYGENEEGRGGWGVWGRAVVCCGENVRGCGCEEFEGCAARGKLPGEVEYVRVGGVVEGWGDGSVGDVNGVVPNTGYRISDHRRWITKYHVARITTTRSQTWPPRQTHGCIKCGELNLPVRIPTAVNMLSMYAHTEPFPFVPAT